MVSGKLTLMYYSTVEYHFPPVLICIFWAPLLNLELFPTHSPPLYRAKLVNVVITLHSLPAIAMPVSPHLLFWIAEASAMKQGLMKERWRSHLVLFQSWYLTRIASTWWEQSWIGFNPLGLRCCTFLWDACTCVSPLMLALINHLRLQCVRSGRCGWQLTASLMASPRNHHVNKWQLGLLMHTQAFLQIWARMHGWRANMHGFNWIIIYHYFLLGFWIW